MKRVKIPSSIGGKSTEVSTSNCYISVPAIIQLDSSMNFEPYFNEGSTTPFIAPNSADKVRKYLSGEADEYWTRSPNIEYDTYFIYIDKDGNTNSYAYGLYEKGVMIELSI